MRMKNPIWGRTATGLLLSGLLAGSVVRAGAQIKAIGPFTGNHAEDWEAFPNFVDSMTVLPDPTAILDGNATISNEAMSVYEPFVADASLGLSGFAQTADGTKGLQIAPFAPTATITFTSPATDFGAFWGAETFGGPSTISVAFFDQANVLLDTESFDYNHEDTADGGLDWHGWHSDTLLGSLVFTGNSVALDSLQANLVPEPDGFAYGLLVSTSSAGLLTFARRRRRRCQRLACDHSLS